MSGNVLVRGLVTADSRLPRHGLYIGNNLVHPVVFRLKQIFALMSVPLIRHDCGLVHAAMFLDPPTPKLTCRGLPNSRATVSLSHKMSFANLITETLATH